MSEEQTKNKVDWDGTGTDDESNYEKIKGIPENNYTFNCDGVTISEFDNWTKTAKENKLVISFKIQDVNKEHDGKIIDYILKPIIKKGGWKNSKGEVMSNSSAYNLLFDLGLAEEAQTKTELVDTIEHFAAFLNTKLYGKDIKVKVGTIKPNTDAEKNKIEKILKQSLTK